MINSILGSFNFKLTENEFNDLKNINPVKFDLPITDSSLVDLIGKYTRTEFGKVGVYKFTNKENGFSYVGSSISLANRLTVGYLGPNLGNRVIDQAIKELGLDKFYLEIYLISETLISTYLISAEAQEELLDNSKSKEIKIFKRNYSLALEQILILIHNPEYNVLKVAGSPAGLTRTFESMLPSFLKNSKMTYFIDNETKKIIYKTDSRTELAYAINVDRSNLSRFIKSSGLFLGRFLILNSENPLDISDYTTDLMSPKDLLYYVDEIRISCKKARMNAVVESI